MNKVFAMWRVAAGVAVGSVVLTGYADSEPLCQWEGYQPQVYQYFKGEVKGTQVAGLERGLEEVEATNGAVSPGYHTQLGMLYSGLGKDSQMIQELNTKETLFPKSATYIDLLMKNAKEGTN